VLPLQVEQPNSPTDLAEAVALGTCRIAIMRTHLILKKDTYCSVLIDRLV